MTRRKRVGVIGTFVWDVIHGRDPRQTPVQEWGGITYALSAFDAALAPDWELAPIVKVGEDLAPQAREFLRGLRHVAPDAHPVVVPYRNNRVELFYTDAERRSEVLSGGVPGWSWIGLAPLVSGLDALYVNLISGFELDLATAKLLRQHFSGPIYCDLHSIVLAVQPDGLRTPRPLPDIAEWCRCFDLLQVNEEELAMIAPDGLALAATALANGVRSLVVTLGARGIVYFAAAGFEKLADVRTLSNAAPRTARAESLGAIRTQLVPSRVAQVAGGGDPTGCGDVWGATYFSRLAAGDSFPAAMSAALDAAARNVEHRGASGLAHYLRRELSPT
ncbi:MAG TPA: carbohydrate kinase family protein, partial [Gammaproteobacteria bacterium]|nr:carbohydrate kinase family protein [Gammaproteobacteria bacterium]